MTTWEYATLLVFSDRAYWTVDGSGERWKKAHLSEYLARAGADGWEVATVENQGGSPTYVFKRPA